MGSVHYEKNSQLPKGNFPVKVLYAEVVRYLNALRSPFSSYLALNSDAIPKDGLSQFFAAEVQLKNVSTRAPQQLFCNTMRLFAAAEKKCEP